MTKRHYSCRTNAVAADSGSFLAKTLEIHPNDIHSFGNGKLLQPQRVWVVVDLDGEGCSLFNFLFFSGWIPKPTPAI